MNSVELSISWPTDFASEKKLQELLVGSFAHEKGTPLTNMRRYLEALGDGVMPH